MFTHNLIQAHYQLSNTRTSGRSVTLYASGEAVAVSYSSSSTNRSVYLGKDIMGSVRSTSTATGVIDDRFEYTAGSARAPSILPIGARPEGTHDVFGQPFQGDLDGLMNLGYMSKPYESVTGLYNYGFRDYRPQQARFTTPDPIRDGNNWFAYVNNDPVNYVDIDGLFGHILAGADVGALIGGVSGAVSTAIQGGSRQEIIASAIGGAISGAVTGALISSGVGAAVIVGGSFIGGAAGSVTSQIISNGGTNSLNTQTVVTKAAIAGGVSAIAAGVSLGATAVGNQITTNSWNSASSLNNTMNGSWGPTAVTAYSTQKVMTTASSLVDIAIGILPEITGL